MSGTLQAVDHFRNEFLAVNALVEYSMYNRQQTEVA